VPICVIFSWFDFQELLFMAIFKVGDMVARINGEPPVEMVSYRGTVVQLWYDEFFGPNDSIEMVDLVRIDNGLTVTEEARNLVKWRPGMAKGWLE
jgi:hypothetical protein